MDRKAALALAKDARAQLPRFAAAIKQRKYLEMWATNEVLSKPICEALDQINASCHMCALGAMFLIKMLKKDKHVSDLGFDSIAPHMAQQVFTNVNNIKNELVDILGERQMCLIESAFECLEMATDYDFYRQNDYSLSADYALSLDYAVKFGKAHCSYHADRLAAILDNMIENDGFFIPPPV